MREGDKILIYRDMRKCGRVQDDHLQESHSCLVLVDPVNARLQDE